MISSIASNLYSGPNDTPLASTSFEAFLKVPEFLRPHTQIYCTRYWFKFLFLYGIWDVLAILVCQERLFFPDGMPSSYHQLLLSSSDPRQLLKCRWHHKWGSYLVKKGIFTKVTHSNVIKLHHPTFASNPFP